MKFMLCSLHFVNVNNNILKFKKIIVGFKTHNSITNLSYCILEMIEKTGNHYNNCLATTFPSLIRRVVLPLSNFSDYDIYIQQLNGLLYWKRVKNQLD